MKIEIDLDIPEGYEFDGFRFGNCGELYFDIKLGTILQITVYTPNFKVFIVKRKTRYITDVKVGEKFKFKRGPDSDVIYKRVIFEKGNEDDINRTKLIVMNNNHLRQYHGVFNFNRDGSYTINKFYNTDSWEVEIIKD